MSLLDIAMYDSAALFSLLCRTGYWATLSLVVKMKARNE
jgi:hypothetical protein